MHTGSGRCCRGADPTRVSCARTGGRAGTVIVAPRGASSAPALGCVWPPGAHLIAPRGGGCSANCRGRLIGKNVIFAGCGCQGDLGRSPPALLVPGCPKPPAACPCGGDTGPGCGNPFSSSGSGPLLPEAANGCENRGDTEDWGRSLTPPCPSGHWPFPVVPVPSSSEGLCGASVLQLLPVQREQRGRGSR